MTVMLDGICQEIKKDRFFENNNTFCRMCERNTMATCYLCMLGALLGIPLETQVL